MLYDVLSSKHVEEEEKVLKKDKWWEQSSEFDGGGTNENRIRSKERRNGSFFKRIGSGKRWRHGGDELRGWRRSSETKRNRQRRWTQVMLPFLRFCLQEVSFLMSSCCCRLSEGLRSFCFHSGCSVTSFQFSILPFYLKLFGLFVKRT